MIKQQLLITHAAGHYACIPVSLDAYYLLAPEQCPHVDVYFRMAIFTPDGAAGRTSFIEARLLAFTVSIALGAMRVASGAALVRAQNLIYFPTDVEQSHVR